MTSFDPSLIRYEEEKEALMRRLQNQNERFMSEKQRQAELARLKREKLKAKQEDTFSTAALVLGLAEKQRAAAQERYSIWQRAISFLYNQDTITHVGEVSLQY